MRMLALCLCLAASVAGQPTSTDERSEDARSKLRPGSISGRVIDAVSSAPIPDAQVLLMTSGQSGTRQTSTTQADGGFHFTNVAAGHYYLQPTQNSYPGPLGGPQFGVEVEVQPGQETNGVQVGLIPPATVSGIVLNDDGEPVKDCTVLLLPAGPTDGDLRPPILSDSNDKGEFLITGVPPDRYQAFVRCLDVLPTEHLLDVVPPTGFETRSVWLPAYYPASPTRAGGQEFPVAYGLDPNLEFRLQATTVSTLQGSISTAPGGAARNPPVIQLRELNDDREHLFTVYMGATNWARKTFSIRTIPPGNYQLIATAQDSPSTAPGTAAIPVTVGDTSPDPVAIVLQPGVTLRGVVEEPLGRQPTRASIKTVTEHASTGVTTRSSKQPAGRVSLESPSSGRFLSVPPVDVDSEKGLFTFPSVPPGLWRVRYNGDMGQDFVERLLFNDKRIDGDEIEVAPGTTPTLRLQLSLRPQVSFEWDHVPAGRKTRWMVQAVAEQEPVTELAEYLATGEPGAMSTLYAPVPGRYRLIALEENFATSRGNSRNRLLRVLAREVDPVEITAVTQQSIPVRCFSTDQARKILQTHLYGDTPPPTAP